jgi:glycosyltransferase involved in cell wall biosynthesis
MSVGVESLCKDGVLCFGGEDWWYHNRGHCDMQFMRQFSRHGPVVYVNSIVMRKPNFSEGGMFFRRLLRKAKSMARGLVKVSDGFWVFSPVTAPVHHLAWARPVNEHLLHQQIRMVMRRIGLNRPLVWVNCPAACDTALGLPCRARVYQRTDRYEEYPGVDKPQISRYDQKLKQQSDLTFYSNRKLFDEEKSQCRRGAYIDHGVDFDLFAGVDRDPWVPPELRGLPRPIVGFWGGIDGHTFDIGLMARVVEQLPKVTFVFIGNTSIDCTPLKRHSHVVMIDRRPYEQIPHYGKCFDACLMPWNQNAWIDACNPIKLKEYLALGKPVVSTPFAQLSEYQTIVHIASNPDDFAAGILHALQTDPAIEKQKLQAIARQYAWSTQAAKILSLLS